MKQLLLSLLTILTFCLPATGQQKANPTADSKSRRAQNYEAAIETIATSTDRDAVIVAGKTLRRGGLSGIAALAKHLDDHRHVKSHHLARAVSGDVELGDQCFWLIQDQLEIHTSKLDASFSPLTRRNTKAWLAARRQMSLLELQRDACIGSFHTILQYERDNRRFNSAPWLKKYAIRLTELDTLLYPVDNSGNAQHSDPATDNN